MVCGIIESMHDFHSSRGWVGDTRTKLSTSRKKTNAHRLETVTPELCVQARILKAKKVISVLACLWDGSNMITKCEKSKNKCLMVVAIGNDIIISYNAIYDFFLFLLFFLFFFVQS